MFGITVTPKKKAPSAAFDSRAWESDARLSEADGLLREIDSRIADNDARATALREQRREWLAARRDVGAGVTDSESLDRALAEADQPSDALRDAIIRADRRGRVLHQIRARHEASRLGLRNVVRAEYLPVVAAEFVRLLEEAEPLLEQLSPVVDRLAALSVEWAWHFRLPGFQLRIGSNSRPGFEAWRDALVEFKAEVSEVENQR